MFVSKNITLLAAILATLTIGHAEKVSQTVGDAIAQVSSSCGNQQVSSPKVEIKPVAVEALVPAESCTCEGERSAKKTAAESAAKTEELNVKATIQPEIQVRARLDPKTAEMLGVDELPLILTKTSKDTAGQESGESAPKSSPVAEATEEKAVEEKAEEKVVEEKAAPVEKESNKPSKKVKTDKKRSKRDAKGKTNKNSSKGKQQKQSQKKQKGKNKK